MFHDIQREKAIKQILETLEVLRSTDQRQFETLVCLFDELPATASRRLEERIVSLVRELEAGCSDSHARCRMRMREMISVAQCWLEAGEARLALVDSMVR